MIGAKQLNEWLMVLAIPVGAAVLCAFLISLLHPILARYALARPNARSSHKIPVPQGAGIAVMVTTFAAIILAGLLASSQAPLNAIAMVLTAAAFLAVVGAIDDWKPIPVLPRLLLQLVAVTAIVLTLPYDLRIVPFVPAWIERTVLVFAILWFVNLSNFMDGIDWMTVAEMLPITTTLAVFSFTGAGPPNVLPVALALAGSLIGFMPFNKPVARIFLGDVGSLPIGLIVAWGLVMLAGDRHLMAAILLPLYYVADATITLGLRLSRGETIWEAHRTHFYQRATTNGISVLQVVSEVFALNIVLAILAGLSIELASTGIDVMLLAVGGAAVGIVLFRFSRPKPSA